MNMEIPLSCYQNYLYDRVQCNSTSYVSLRFSYFDLFRERFFLCNRRKCRNSLRWIKCSSFEQGLRPRPQPKPSKLDPGVHKITPLKETHVMQSSVGICSQIEKLVLCKKYRDALEMFEIFELEGGFHAGNTTLDALINACVELKSIRGVKKLCNYMVDNGFEPDQYMRNRVLLMHVKCGMMIDACRLFDQMPERNAVSWNTIISGHVDSGNYVEAFRLFILMWEEYYDCGPRTFATMIRASAGLELIFPGRQLHSCAIKADLGQDIFVSCALIDMYSKCGSLEDAHCVFDEMPDKTIVGWNSIIAGYALHGYSEEALDLYYEMRDSGIKMDHFTFSIIIRICSRLASVACAKQAHASLVRNGFGLDVVANTALVDFYSKWGKVDDARHVFDRMSCRNIISWNALIAGYGNHGRGVEAIDMFEKMLREGKIPNHVTFLAVLSACSISGLFERGWEIFQSMTRDHKIKPRAMHYACMIELLGREGLLDEAYALIRKAPFQPTANMWAALLRACRVHGNLELGKFAAEKLYGMEPEKLSNYIVLLNIYNSSGKLKEAADVVQTLKRKGLRMLPACSWIEVNNQPHAFLSGDKHHVQIEKVVGKVDELMLKISKLGYVPEEQNFMLPDVDEHEEKIQMYHSEKLAIAYGLLNTLEQTPLQIVQSHRICSDCHFVIKLIAMITKREIVIRDASRFHHFRDGSCSCGDYW
ncbi:pentatricopeptide repeat-containing protein At5g50390, chloroplastic isoform X1 [Benincasa hispida]|uniref:pentatricopeptide repeat-containing protein At5g50390, chloroplastic isoform X1 n=2 Tax=Benincasa hispida TaxID=102211 RepID=UPI0018FF5A6C|nr:pentatricopeptide repeat-containing protein At5g50390, chloroplastic isoform X1 [Benincasa hispida]XP_038890389.1 pentatricopeptide repeat-containing protein At5g50390, chloroplastic isoform X1 [Benincasa hispida]XP_038890390.1 pentatricopeptide repeat-containing protein At5g50390, chloroplastic isoform X1 [Benincasa hispida]